MTNKQLTIELWSLWESMAECGQLTIGPKFSKQYDKLKIQVQKKISGDKKKESHPVYSYCVEFWLKKFHPNWTFNASEGKALNEIIDKMTKYFIAGHQCEPTTQQLFDFFEHFCLRLPNFYKSKNLKILNQNFDGIITEIKSGRNPNTDFNSKNSRGRFSEFAS